MLQGDFHQTVETTDPPNRRMVRELPDRHNRKCNAYSYLRHFGELACIDLPSVILPDRLISSASGWILVRRVSGLETRLESGALHDFEEVLDGRKASRCRW